MDDYFEKFDKHFNAEMAKSTALGPGLVLGKIFSIGVADGYAYYEVVRVNKKTVRIKWRKDLCLDDYQYFGWGEGGLVDIGLIEQRVRGMDNMAMLTTEMETPNADKD